MAKATRTLQPHSALYRKWALQTCKINYTFSSLQRWGNIRSVWPSVVNWGILVPPALCPPSVTLSCFMWKNLFLGRMLKHSSVRTTPNIYSALLLYFFPFTGALWCSLLSVCSRHITVVLREAWFCSLADTLRCLERFLVVTPGGRRGNGWC